MISTGGKKNLNVACRSLEGGCFVTHPAALFGYLECEYNFHQHLRRLAYLCTQLVEQSVENGGQW